MLSSMSLKVILFCLQVHVRHGMGNETETLPNWDVSEKVGEFVFIMPSVA